MAKEKEYRLIRYITASSISGCVLNTDFIDTLGTDSYIILYYCLYSYK